VLCFICCHAECHYAECHYAECHYAECHYAECHYAECHYAERHGVVGNTQAEHVKHREGLNVAETLFA
jgi:hypothetical protein